MSEIVKIYIPAPTKETGLTIVNARKMISPLGGYNAADFWQRFFPDDEGKSWFLDRASALASAEAKRIKRLESLKKQIARVEKLGPFCEETPNV